MQKTADKGWDLQRHVFLVLIMRYCMHERQVISGNHRDFYAGPKVAVLEAKTTDEGWDP